MVPICADIEAEITELSIEEKAEFLAEMGQEESGLDRLIHAGVQAFRSANLFYCWC